MEHQHTVIVLPGWLHYMHTNAWAATFSSVPVCLLLVGVGWFYSSLLFAGLGFFGGASLTTLGMVFSRIAQRITKHRFGVGIERFVYHDYRFILVPTSAPAA